MITTEKKTNFYQAAIPIITSVSIAYLTVGMTLGVIPGFVQNTLMFNSFIVGLIVGLQPIATLLSRAYTGKFTDTCGGKKSKSTGITLIVISGIVYLAAAIFSQYHIVALSLLVVARIVHGISESFILTGALTWVIGLVGQDKSGRLMTWNGLAMYAGITLGAPLSILLTKSYDIKYVFILLMVFPVASWLTTVKLPAVNVSNIKKKVPFFQVLGIIANQGISLSFSTMAYGSIISFIALFFTQNRWGDASMAFTTFGVCYILTRLFFASLPDKWGGYKVAMLSFFIQIIGQLLIWSSVSKIAAIAGCGLTGIGFSLVFPALGVLVLKKTDPQQRGTALGAYAAFFDLALGLAAPLAGLIANWSGNYQSVYLFGGGSCLLAMGTLILKRE